MMEENIFRSDFGKNCQVMQGKGRYFTTQTGFALPLNSPLTKIFDTQLIKFRDGGLISRAWRHWQPMVTHCNVQRVVAIELNHLFTAFLLLLLGMVLAVVIIPCERLHWKVVGKRNTLRVQQIQAEQQKGLFTLPPQAHTIPSMDSNDVSFTNRFHYTTEYSPPLAPLDTM
ncbi:hypothetical protein GWK47_000243 [Chionoecetes opilio]|uniref:Uncharacterized protein n=1 Tax=Chionoecetes opilio TaxID=41210 RepID=A0A8J8WAD4_CHIOP|nr:hypothetical protein GWK47_000243 [Chionoecetes opilio]